jgi:hypothetical protein
MEEYLRTAECLTFDQRGSAPNSGPNRCVLSPGGPVARMAWMTLPPGIYRGFHTSYKTQIAAYELDKLLKLEMVPPTVERQVQGVSGAATLWVENVDIWDGEAPLDAGRGAWEKQLSRMTIFDAFIGNLERNRATRLRDGVWNLILLDHTRAFGLTTQLSTSPLNRIDRVLWERVLALTRKELDARLGPWLDDNQIAAMLDRRERMKIAIERLIAQKGEAAVLLR